MDWFKQHGDTIATLGVFALCFWTLNEKMNDGFANITKEMNLIEKEVSIIKTVMIMKQIMPLEMAHKEEKPLAVSM